MQTETFSGPANNTPVLDILSVNKYPWKLIVIVMITQFVMPVVMMIYLMNNTLYMNIVSTLNSITAGFVIPTITNYTVYIIVIIGIIIAWPGKISGKSVGLIKTKVFPALGYTLGIWIIPQLIILIYLTITGGQFILSEFWLKYGLVTGLGVICGQFFGNALYEEVIFRGFLVPQFYRRFSKSIRKIETKALIFSIILSQLVFALIHIPNRIHNGESNVINLLIVILPIFLIGVFLTILYLRSQNLFLCIAIHSLMNYPAFVLESPIESKTIMAILALLLIIFYPQIRRTLRVG